MTRFEDFLTRPKPELDRRQQLREATNSKPATDHDYSKLKKLTDFTYCTLKKLNEDVLATASPDSPFTEHNTAD